MSAKGAENASPPEPVSRFVPVALTKPALTAAVGIDGGAIFQILATENLGLSSAAIGAAFGLGLLSLPLQLWAARMPLRLAKRNLQLFLVLAAIQSGLLAWLLAVGATDGLASTALVVTVTAEVAVSVLFATAWQPLLSTRASTRDRQRINAGWTALGRGLLAGALVVFSAVDVAGRSLVLLALSIVAIGVAVNLGRVTTAGINHHQAPTPTSDTPPQPLTPAMRWILASFIVINFGALPLWLVYLSEVIWPTVDLGMIGAIQTIAVVAALLAWRTTEGDVGIRAMVGVLMILGGSACLLTIGQTAESRTEHTAVLVVTVTMTFGMMYASLALLEMTHRLVGQQDRVVRIFTLIDVVDSSSLQMGLFLGGLLVTWSARTTTATPYGTFVAAMSLLAAAVMWQTVRITKHSGGDRAS
ncbi:MAG: hypothetical protein WA966_00265 [Ornithinimicrobium sp.]